MTFSRLTLGEPRLKSKLRGGSVEIADPCVEPLEYGTNVSRDGGFEQQLATFTGSPGGDEIPRLVFDSTWSTVWSDNSTGPTDSYWVWRTGQGTPTVSTTAPRSGTYHLEFSASGTLPGGAAVQVVPSRVLCTYPGTAGFNWYSTRVEAGDILTWGGYVLGTGDGTPEVRLTYTIYDSGWSTVEGPTHNTFTLSASYAYYEATTVVGSGGYYVQAFLNLRNSNSTSGGSYAWRADDMVLGVTK